MSASARRVVFDCNVYIQALGNAVNLALAANADTIVSRDKHLLNLMNPARMDGRDFIARFPNLSIIAPPLLLRTLTGN